MDSSVAIVIVLGRLNNSIKVDQGNKKFIKRVLID